jgi:hypothetical protein
MKLALSLEQIEANLEAGAIRAPATSGNAWSVRRNGRTRTWKTRPFDFEIPVKIGFKYYSMIDQSSTFATDNSADYRIIST